MWDSIGNWLRDYGGSRVALVGSLLTGNVPGAIAAGQALVATATGTTDPNKAMEALQNNPESLLRLKELAYQNEADIRRHLEAMTMAELESKKADLNDAQASHAQTQETIRNGDNSEDKDIRMVRPTQAKQSWHATVAYVAFIVIGDAGNWHDVNFSWEIASFLSAPAWAYLGLRTVDKFGLGGKK